MFDNYGYGNPVMPPKRKNGMLGPDDYALKMSDASQAALDRAAVAPAPQKQSGLLSFWDGGDKFTARDGIAGLLAAVGDAFAQQSGGQPAAVGMLAGGRAKAIAEANAAAKKKAEMDQLIQAGVNAGRTRDEMALIAGGAADYGDFKQPEAPAFVRNLEAWKKLLPEQRNEVLAFEDMMNPRFTNTAAGTQFVPRTTIPQGHQPMTDEEIRAMGLNPGGPQAAPAGNFRR